MKPEFAIQNDSGSIIALMRTDDGFAIVASHIAVADPLAVQLWTRSELIAIRNQINKALNMRAERAGSISASVYKYRNVE